MVETTKHAFIEMNIRIGSTSMPSACPQKLLQDPVIVKQTQEAAISAVLDGYTVIVYNFLKEGSGLLQPTDTCEFKGFDLEKIWEEQEQRRLSKVGSQVSPNFQKIRQLTRLTIFFSSNAYIHQVINLSAKTADKQTKVLNSYDIVAIRPDHNVEQVFEQSATKSDVEIISVDCSQRFQYYFQKSWVKQAQAKGIMFEICYGSGCLEGGSTTRRQFLTNALQLVKLSKGKGIILSAEASQIMFLRSPVDVQVIANMLGITNTQDSIATVRENCLKVFQHAHLRKTFKGVAEVVALQKAEESKMVE